MRGRSRDDRKMRLELLGKIGRAAEEGKILRSTEQTGWRSWTKDRLKRERVALRDENLIRTSSRASFDDPDAMDVLGLTAAAPDWMAEERARLETPLGHWLARHWKLGTTTLVALAAVLVVLV